MKINLHQSVLTQIDNIEGSNRSSLEKAALLFPLSGAGLITNIGAAASESLHLLGKLSLAGVKYGAIGTLHVLTGSNACESVYKKLPDGKSLLTTLIKIRKLLQGIFYSLIGFVDPRFNLQRQEELGLYVKKPVEVKPMDKLMAVPPPPKEDEPIPTPIVTPQHLGKKKTIPKGCLKKPVAKKIMKVSREELANIQMAKFLRAFQIMERSNTSLPKKKVHFPSDTALVHVFPAQKMAETKKETPPEADPNKKFTTTASSIFPSLGFVAGMGAAILTRTSARLNNLAPTPVIQGYVTNPIASAMQDVVAPTLVSTLANTTMQAPNLISTLANATMKDIVAPTLVSTLANSTMENVIAPALASPLATATMRDVVAPTLVSTLANATTTATPFLTNVASNCTALAAPALTLAQLVPASLQAAVTNGTCSLVASAVNALAAPALTVAQIVNGNAPIVATEMAKHVPMSWTSLALIVSSLAIRVLPIVGGAVFGN